MDYLKNCQMETFAFKYRLFYRRLRGSLTLKGILCYSASLIENVSKQAANI